MALELCMIGLITQDMDKSLAFYRQLGLAIPEDSDGKTHVEVKMNGGLTFFLDSRPARWDSTYAMNQLPDQRKPSNAYPFILEFLLEGQAAVEAKYQELIALGHQSYHAPYTTVFSMCFAMVYDPDGNTILLSGNVAKKEATPAE